VDVVAALFVRDVDDDEAFLLYEDSVVEDCLGGFRACGG